MKRVLFSLFAILVCISVQADPVRLVFVGDILLDDGPGKVVSSGRDPLVFFDQQLPVTQKPTPVKRSRLLLDEHHPIFSHPT